MIFFNQVVSLLGSNHFLSIGSYVVNVTAAFIDRVEINNYHIFLLTVIFFPLIYI